MSAHQQRVHLLTLSERMSAKGNRYLAGWLGKASVVAFAGDPDKHGNPTWDLFVCEVEQRQQPAANQSAPRERAIRHGGGVAEARRSGQERGEGWRGSQYRRPAGGHRNGPQADDGEAAQS